MYLCDLKIGESAYVKKVKGNNDILIRLYNLGLTSGTKVKLILNSKGIKAYSFRNTLIAIRNIDASNILIGDIND